MLKLRSTKLMCLLIAFIWTTVIIGSSYAYFIDSVQVNGNIVTTGNLKAEMQWSDDMQTWHDVVDPDDSDDYAADAIFSGDRWEPNYTEVKYIKIKNTGNLAFQYRLDIIPTLSPANPGYKLGEVIEAYVDEVGENYKAPTGYKDFEGRDPSGTIASMITSDTGAYYGTLLEAKETITLAVALHMQHTAGNEYQGLSVGDGFNLRLYATQTPFEYDSFGNTYDEGAASDMPKNEFAGGSASGNVSVVNGVTTTAVTLSGGAVQAYVPAGVKVNDGVTKLTLAVTVLEKSQNGIKAGKGESLLAVDVHVDGLSADNTVPLKITLSEALATGLNVGNTELYHVENGKKLAMTQVMSAAELNTHNQYYYNPVDGTLTLNMATFSEVAVLAEDDAAWKGTVAEGFSGGTGTKADPYIIANADQLAYMNALISADNDDEDASNDYGSKHYALTADINIGGSENYEDKKVIWYPIGYQKLGTGSNKAGETQWYTYGGAFSGTFDGAGHVITGIYQNTWAMDGNYDNGYWNAAMGLFGYVYGGTVKNLTIDNFYSEGEFAPTGCVTAYAAGKAKFENIAITNSHPQTYNTGVAGIVGWDNGGDTEAEASNFTFKNITVDSSNTISALWGSWDVAAAGLLGYLGKYSTAKLDNCHVSATIDVYNDVCGNYQYYWYRYCGMLIGTVDKTNADGKLDLSNITATNCTVNFGDRHEYYYCEFVDNSIASYTHDYQFSRIAHSNLNFTDSNGNGRVDTKEISSVTGCTHDHEAKGYETKDINGDGVVDSDVLKEDKQAVHIPFYQIFGGYGWGVDGVEMEEYNLDIAADRQINTGEESSEEKFVSKFTHTGFTYRVGNQNIVSLGSLFAKKDGATIIDSGVVVNIVKVDENSNVSGTFTANTTDWTKGTIQFSGTGVVKVTIQDYNFCKPTVLYLEVVDAVNATTATSATSNNVVLLNNCGFSSLEVSGGYSLYGNGFTMTCGSDSAVADMGSGFVTLDNGTLDNVQIVCPNFDYAALYKSNLTSNDNRSQTTNGTTRYYNAKSGVMVSGNSQILNSRISGGRASVNVSGGNVVIDNSRIELGAVASILVGPANSLKLNDVTLVQKPTASTYNSSKKLMGFSVLYMCNSEGNAARTTIEGSFVQQAWACEADKQYVPSAGQGIVDDVLTNTAYIHNINGKDSLNLGFAYMPESGSGSVNIDNITDNRADKDAIPYEHVRISGTGTYVYSYKNSKGTADSFKTETEYVPNKYSDIITVTYSDTADGLTTGKSYGTDGWVYELNVDLDKLSSYALDFSKLSMSVNGTTVTYFKVNGNAKPTSPVAVAAGGTTYTLTATVNGAVCTAIFKVTGTETTKASPLLVTKDYEAALLVGEAGNALSKDTWHGAAPVLVGIKIKYWSVAEKQYKTINLSDYTPTKAGKQNGTNNTWTYSPANGDFTLTLTGGQVHSNNNVDAMPVVWQGKLYYVANGSNGLVNYGNTARTIPVTYSFKDNNGGTELTFNHTWSIECADGNTAYDYSDFCNGNSKTFKINKDNGSGCVTPDTLVTLADGSKKEIQQVTYEDQLLVWDFYKGEYAAAPAAIISNHGYGENTVIALTFSDGTVVKAVNGHAFVDLTLNDMVVIDAENVDSYVGHSFAKAYTDGYEAVTLTSYTVSTEMMEAWGVLTAGHFNCITEDMISFAGSEQELASVDYFEYGDGLKYDEAAMQADIATYGVYTYEEFAPYLSEAQFEALGIKYMTITVGKGKITHDYILELINTYVK